MDAPRYWSYDEPSWQDDLLVRLAVLRQHIHTLMPGGTVGKADDAAAQAERDRIQREHDKAQSLFEALKRDVEKGKK